MSHTVTIIKTRALELADSVDGDFTDVAQVVPWVNEGQREIALYADPVETSKTDTIATASTDAIYTASLQSNFWKMKRMEYGSKKMFFVEFDELQSLADASKGLGSSEYIYSLWNDEYVIYTSADYSVGDEIKYWYFKWPTDVTLASSTADLPTEYADCLFSYVGFKMAQANRESGLAQRLWEEFKGKLEDVRRANRRMRTGPRKIKTELVDKYAF
ncbi:hypothetical protein LCGC14_2482620 [marine sediment metagenome]|uniref:Uncharacterized protein n=1 Tax=marine sediment metagenome TaxID=412755 RepID=A0A0F9B758_9ZZZZ